MFSDKRRITEQLLAYWNSLRGNRKWPAVQSVTQADLPALWDDLLLVGVQEKAGVLSYTTVHQGRNIGQMLDNADLALQEGLTQQLAAVYHAKDYLQDEETYTNSKGYRIKYRRIILPLGKGDGAVDHLLCGMRHKVDDRGAAIQSP